jgi:Ca-activated chloride channel homolog
MPEEKNATFLLKWRPMCLCLALGLCFQSFLFYFFAPAVSAQDSSPNFAITSSVMLVALPVTVRDHQGRFISDLDASDFQVYEDGRPQKITLFQHEDIPVMAGLVVDHSASMAAKQLEVLEGAQTLVEKSNPEDREFVVNFSENVSFGLPPSVPFTSKVPDLLAALSNSPLNGRTALYDAIAVALEHLQAEPSEKKVLLLISDGGDNASSHTLAQVLQMAQSANVLIYTIGLFDENSADQNPSVLAKFARETGGLAYLPMSPSEVVSDCKEIAADIRHQYTLGYNPSATGRSGYRKIRVGVTLAGRGRLTVRTREGYFYSSKTPTQPTSSR